MNMLKYIVSLSALLILVGAGCAQQPTTLEQGLDVLSTPAGEVLSISFTDLEGNSRLLTEFSGTPMVVNSWASWCAFCTKELSDFAQVQKEMGDSIRIVAVNRRESVKSVKSYLSELGVIDGLVFFQDKQDMLYKSIGGFSMPETLFISAEGKILFHKRGVLNKEQLRSLITQYFNL